MSNNMDQAMWTGGTLLVVLFVFFKFMNPINIIPISEITSLDVTQFIGKLEGENLDQHNEISRLFGDLDYWSNLNQAEEIKILNEKIENKNRWIFTISLFYFMMAAMGSLFAFISFKGKINKIKDLEYQLKKVKKKD